MKMAAWLAPGRSMHRIAQFFRGVNRRQTLARHLLSSILVSHDKTTDEILLGECYGTPSPGRGKGRGAKTTGPKFKPAKGTPGRKAFIADNNTVCESCDSHGHFARDCPLHKPNANDAQKKRGGAWAEKNNAQTRELKVSVYALRGGLFSRFSQSSIAPGSLCFLEA